MIEKYFDIAFVSQLALREKQIQQNYRPIIAVHKWFARRPGSLFRSLLLSEFSSRPIAQTYYGAHDFQDKVIGDPFMGGGTPVLEANRVGCDVIGTDINPMAAWVVREEIDAIDLDDYGNMASRLLTHLEGEIGGFYKTRCPITGRGDAAVKYFLWVKTGICTSCEKAFDLFPGYLLAEKGRHTTNLLVCSACGELNRVADLENPPHCQCGNALRVDGVVKRNICSCPHCGSTNSTPFHGNGPPSHRLFAIEYHNDELTNQAGRLFKSPDGDDLRRVEEVRKRWSKMRCLFVPDDLIPTGDETNRLHRWGYRSFRELFNARQLLALEVAARFIKKLQNERLRQAFATNFSDLLRYQNMLCRYDTAALKSLDIFSIHGFPVGYIQVESNFLGIRNAHNLPVGSGGWVNIIDKYAKAKRFCTAPFEIDFTGKTKAVVPIRGEWIGKHNPTNLELRSREVDIRCESATTTNWPTNGLDAAFTDPPYYGMVQYGELMQFCYVWLRKLMGSDYPGFSFETTRNREELTGNDTASRGIEHFAEGLAQVYSRVARALKPGGPLAFTYHHNKQEAYLAAAMAILDSGLTCSASLPCPAEMGGSIHIRGTNSSIVDTVFVCRRSGTTRRRWLFENATELSGLISDELTALRSAGMKPTAGDVRCIAFGHITRMAIWKLRPEWRAEAPTHLKLEAIRRVMDSIATVDAVQKLLDAMPVVQPEVDVGLFAKHTTKEFADAVAF